VSEEPTGLRVVDADLFDEVRFDDRGLIPAVICDVADGSVLMVGYMNRESLERTIASGRTWFWSRSRQEYWAKGETSGNIQIVHDITVDCDADTLLVTVTQIGGGACHTGTHSCFVRQLATGL
jgi:phosphoribosyl-AMP cyclohydrolase / phosphoribosyl-ATP pyrophosphohydrolase